MRIDAGQHMRMEQQMKLSPRMIQSMEILQMASLELAERIEQELESNPLLELQEARGAISTEAPPPPEGEQPLVVSPDGKDSGREFDRADSISEQYGDQWSQNTQESAEYRPTRRHDPTDRDAKMDAMANTVSRSPSIEEQLLDQWRFVETDEATRAAGEHLIRYIDDDGYIRTDIEQIRFAAPRFTIEQIESAIDLLQQRLDPPGLAARSLQECLLIQIDLLVDEEGDDGVWPIARTLVAEHLKDIEMNRLPRIAAKLGVDIDRVKQGLERLRRLDPRPGRRLVTDPPQVVIPDVLVEYDPSTDSYVAALARGHSLPLRINPAYRKLSQDRGQQKETRQYLTKNLNNARWLIDAIHQRNNTLLRVVNIVIDAQREFLDHGLEHMKPLPMIHVADQLGIHVGTVSRAVSDKYIQTPRGIFPLRMFFSGGTESASGQEMSWSAVQAKLKQIIDGEDPAEPWSDEKLAEELSKQGITIARRTVAKYREQLNIPPARRRRKF